MADCMNNQSVALKGFHECVLWTERVNDLTLLASLSLRVCLRKDMTRSMTPISLTSKIALVLLGMLSCHDRDGVSNCSNGDDQSKVSNSNIIIVFFLILLLLLLLRPLLRLLLLLLFFFFFFCFSFLLSSSSSSSSSSSF